ncbi:hypothetical protein AHMF7605_00965 [Adhaeribacter arboris]|uniref:LysM domain-containing protein n=1 Tax=Adhaeribacter arboris TaxID=2072846 RepID=A0A2T2Y9J0_9BACT|nr:LysM peptidoglycan-binding domain-containing protein [Adhaeribacter arboris]PSR52189.1 hypothetical protein AHMF7605_00965 [Adhaeribacter arboris]
MIKGFLAAVFTCGFIQVSQAAIPAVVDSVGTVVKNGKTFTVHKVAPKETIYALARRYGISVTQVQQANPGVTSLVVGQTVFVPSRGKANSAESTSSVISQQKEASASVAIVPTSPGITNPATANNGNNKVHQVGARQTLFAIARLYNVSTTDLKKWNNLTSDDLQEGQTLVVTPPGNSSVTSTLNTVAIADKNEDKVATTVPASAPTTSPKPVIRREEIKSATASVATRDNSEVKEERTETRYTENLSRISESGMAEVMDKAEGNKYLALHKTAPVGTILQVKNTLNNQSVYVRVSGKLPENSTSDRVIIRVSKRAYQKLAATDSRFQVEVNYMP